MSHDHIKLALVRGNGLNSWEGKVWNSLPPEFQVTGFCSQNNLFPTDDLTFPIERLTTTTDSRVGNKISILGWGQFQRMRGLEKKLADFSIAHTVEIYNYYTYQAVRAKLRNTKLKVVATVWDNSFGRFEYNYWTPFTPPQWWRAKITTIINANARGVDRFIAVSAYSARLLEDYGVASNKIKVIAPAIAPVATFTSEVIKKYNLENKHFYLMVNRLRKEKGVYDCLYAWKMFVAQHANQHPQLVIIGDGPERSNMIRLTKEWRLEDTILYIPQLPNSEVRQLYPFARALILASLPTPVWQEQFGYVLAEAMAAGCPVVSTLSGAIPEVVQGGGVLVPPGNPPAIAVALATLTSHTQHEYYKALAFSAAERFKAEHFKKQLTELYTEIL